MPMKMFQTTPGLSGTSLGGLVRSHLKWPQAHPRTVGTMPQALEDILFRQNMRMMFDEAEDFGSEVEVYEIAESLFAAAGDNIIGTTAASTGLVEIPRGGYLVAAELITNTTLATDDTNFVTVAIANKLGAGSGTTAMLAATAANTTQITGGSAITANVPRALTLNATAANLNVAKGDVLIVTVTPAATSANTMLYPRVRLHFATTPYPLFTPRIVRTAGSPRVGPIANGPYGESTALLTSTSEAQLAGWDLADQLLIPGNSPKFFAARVKIPVLPGTAGRFVMGLATAFNSTLSSTTKYVWFKLNASGAVVLESKDGTTTNTNLAPTNQPTLTAGTYYWFLIDATDPTNVVFWTDLGSGLVRMRTSAKIDISAMVSTDLLQPVFYLQKDSGATVPQATCDYMRYGCARI